MLPGAHDVYRQVVGDRAEAGRVCRDGHRDIAKVDRPDVGDGQPLFADALFQASRKPGLRLPLRRCRRVAAAARGADRAGPAPAGDPESRSARTVTTVRSKPTARRPRSNAACSCHASDRIITPVTPARPSLQDRVTSSKERRKAPSPSRSVAGWGLADTRPAFSLAETTEVTLHQMVGVSSTSGLWSSVIDFHPGENSMKSARVG